jgi:hypothetical protein
MQALSLFVFFAACVGFVLGTFTLLGPLRGLLESMRDEGVSAETEAAIVRLAILVLIVVSLILAGWLSRRVRRTSLGILKFGLPSLAVGLAGLCVGWWLVSAQGGDAGESFVGSRFTFGPYPSEARLAQLASEGYSGVISLLHPAVVPFETRLIGEERRTANAAGLEFIHAPMLPWVSDNEESLNIIKTIVERGHGRYYVHCLLGKDRVRIAKRWVQELNPMAEIGLTEGTENHEKNRQLHDGMLWERGRVVFVGEGIFLTPQPAKNEYVSYLLSGSNGPVFSLLDPHRLEDRPWIEEERRIYEGNGMELVVLPIPVDPYDGHVALAVADRIRRSPGSKVVHAFLSLDSGRSPSAEAFVQALYSGLPPLPPALFVEPLFRGRARVIAPNVALGPRPRNDEFAGTLHRRGVREFVYLGDAQDSEAREDRGLCLGAGLDWRGVTRESDLLEIVARGGPWYLYGPLAELLGPKVARAMGPALPVRISSEAAGVP